MATKPRSVTIELTPTQRVKLQKLTGTKHSEFRVEVATGASAKKPLSAKAAPRTVLDSPDRSGPSAPGLPMV